MSDQLLDQLDSVYANARRLVAGIGDDQWELPTPCSEWDVRQLVNHMGFTARTLAASANRADISFAPDDDHVGADALAGLDRLATASVAAWRSPGAVDGMVQIPAEMPAVAALSANVLDIGIHCWDLATATGQDHGLGDDQIKVIDEADRMLISDEVRAGGGFGENLDPADEQPLTTMLAFVGRRA